MHEHGTCGIAAAGGEAGALHALKPSRRVSLADNLVHVNHFSPQSLALALSVLAFLCGCAGLPHTGHGPPSMALPADANSALARLAAQASPDPELSGFRLMPSGPFALDARLELIRRAERSLDVQYYQIENDETGRFLLRQLRDAASRGVRVRLLIDDLYTAGDEALWLGLAVHAGIEVRLFNPFTAGRAHLATRLLGALFDFERVNRRMHNKLLVADNAFAVTGGRNIADEYFMRGAAANFIDMDILASGPVVRELSDLFDRFWNSEQAYPIGSLAAPVEAAASAPEHDVEPGPFAVDDIEARDGVLARLADGRLALRFAPVQLYADVPAKAAPAGASPRPATAMDSAMGLFGSARHEVQLVSPYFVPGQRGMAKIREATAAGVKLTVMTNSLASTDEPMAYWGYARYRGEMLSLGVTLIELNPASPSSRGLGGGGSLGSSVGRLHAKVALVDRRWVLIGSMNMDGRSSRTNTELALVVDSRELAADLAALLHDREGDDHYRLRLSTDRAASIADADDTSAAEPRVEWVSAPGRPLRVHRSEPHVGWLSRVRLGFVSLFVPEDLL